MKRVFAFVFARGGSKGLPRKPSKRRIIVTRRAIRVAKQIAEVEKVSFQLIVKRFKERENKRE